MKTDATQGDFSSDHLIKVSLEERHEMIAVGAYFLSERRSFAPGQELQDWCDATTAIDRLFDEMRKVGMTRRHYEEMGLRNALRLWADGSSSPSAQ